MWALPAGSFRVTFVYAKSSCALWRTDIAEMIVSITGDIAFRLPAIIFSAIKKCLSSPWVFQKTPLIWETHIFFFTMSI